ncbi:hypothetical protein AB6E06_22815 [Vibrio splendidus]
MRKLVYSVKQFKNKEGVTRYVANYLNESKAGDLYHSDDFKAIWFDEDNKEQMEQFTMLKAQCEKEKMFFINLASPKQTQSIELA